MKIVTVSTSSNSNCRNLRCISTSSNSNCRNLRCISTLSNSNCRNLRCISTSSNSNCRNLRCISTLSNSGLKHGLWIFVLVFILWSFPGCDFMVYYTFLSSESNTHVYNPEDSGDPAKYAVYNTDFEFYNVREPNNEKTYTDSFIRYFDEADEVNFHNEKNLAFSKSVNEKFSIIILPDTQYYSAYYPHLFNIQAEWIAAQKENHNIVFVILKRSGNGPGQV